MKEIQNLQLPDGGPIYTETDLSHVIVEPFNALSAIPFILIALYWLGRLRGSYRDYSFLFFASSLLLIGGVGGTIYHAFRLHSFFLMMDYLPIVLLCYAASVYFASKLVKRKWHLIPIYLSAFALQGLNSALFSPAIAVNTGYITMALVILLPTILYLRSRKFKHGHYVLFALFSFITAIFFRFVDHYGWIESGTHFLWHVFGAIACQFMFLFLYWTNEKKLQLHNY
jgi:hemolysin III